MATFKISSRKYFKKVIFPIFDKYPLLTTKAFNYIRVKQAYEILEKNIRKQDLLFKIWSKKPPKNYISPALIDFKPDTQEIQQKIFKA